MAAAEDNDTVEAARSTLTAEEVPFLYQPGAVTDRLALRKAYALVLLKWRGCALPELEGSAA